MSGLRRLRVRELHPNLLCILCGGYYVDATTIVECLHSFCKTCIVRYLESSKFCPICDVQVHKTKPLLSIRPDKTLQDIVYKLVPGLYPNEMCKRREFYSSHPETPPATPEDGGSDLGRCYTLPDDPISLALYPASASTSTSLTSSSHHPGYRNHVHLPCSPSKMARSFHQRSSESRVRYLQCPAGVSVAQLKRLIRAKFGVGPAHPMALLTITSEDPLHDSLTLVDVAYITSWQRSEPLQLLYRIYEKASKKIKLDPEVCVADTHSLCEEMPKLEPSVGSGAPVCTAPQGTVADYSTAPLLQAVGPVGSPAEQRPSKGGVSKGLEEPERPSEGPTTTTQQESLLGKVSRAAGVVMDAPLKDSQVIQNCDSLLGMTQGMAGSGASQTAAVEPVVTYPGVFATPSNGVSVGVALVPSELGLLAPTNVTCAIIPGAAASLPVLCGAGGEWGVTGHQAGGQVVAPPPPPSAAAAAAPAVTVAAVGERGPQVPGEAGGSCKNGVSGEEEGEGEEVQLKISESGVMSVCGKDTTLEGVLNSLESEAGELLSKIESGSLGEEFPSVSCPKNSEKKRSKSKAGLGQGKAASKAEDKGDKCQPLHKGDKTSAVPGSTVEVDNKRAIGSSPRKDSSEAATITTTTTTATTTTTFPLEDSTKQGSINGERDEATASADGVPPDTHSPGEQLSSCKETKEEGAKSSRASHIPASLAAASMANLNKPLLKASSSKIQQGEDKHKEQKLSNNGLSTKKEVRPEVRCPAGGGAVAGGGGCRRTSHSYGYKTLKTPPKSWNPTISREHLAAGKSLAGKGPKDPPRPNKFFKARNRSVSVEARSGTGAPRPGAGVVVKIDPKTLGPISASVRGEAGTAPTSLPSQTPALPPVPQVTAPQTPPVTVTLTPLQDKCGGVRGATAAVVPDAVEVPSTVRKDVTPTPQPVPSEGKESTNHSAKVVGTTNIQDNNTPNKTNSNSNINNNNSNSNNNNNNNNNNSSSNNDNSSNNSNKNNNQSSKSGKPLGSNSSVNASRNVKIQSVQTQVSVGKGEPGVSSSTRTDKAGSRAAGVGGVGIPISTPSTSHSTQLKLAPCSTSCLTSQVPVDPVSSLALPQLQPQPLTHPHTQYQHQPLPQPQHQPQLHPPPQHQSQPQLQTQLQPHAQPQLQLQSQHQPQSQLQPQPQPQAQPQIQPQPQQQLAIGSPAIGIIPSSGVSFTGAIGTLPLPYYTSPPLGYPTYPYFYQTPEAIGLMPPHSFFSTCLPPRSPLSSRTIGGPKMMPELPLQLPMMPVVSQGPNQALSPRPMTPPSPRTANPTQPPRPYPPHSPRQSCTNPSSRPHTPQSPKPLAPAQSPKPHTSAQSTKPLVPSQSPKPLSSAQSSKPLAPAQSPKPFATAQSPKALAPAQSPKPLAPAQSPKPYTPAQSPKPPTPAQSPKPPATTQSPKPPTPAQSPKLLASAQSPKPPTPAQSPKPYTAAQSPKPPTPVQSPKCIAPAQSLKSPALAQSSMPPATAQSPKPPVQAQSLKSPTSSQSSMPPAPAQSPKPPAQAQSSKPLTPAQSPIPPAPAHSPVPPAPPHSPKPPIPVQSPKPPGPAQSPKPPGPAQSPKPPAPAQSPKPSPSAQSPKPPPSAQSSMPDAPAQSPKSPVPTQSSMLPASAESPKPPTPTQSLTPQIQSPKQFSVAQSVATQLQSPKLNHTTTSVRHSTTYTSQSSHSDKMTPMPQQMTSSLKPGPQSSVVSSSGSSFCPQNSFGKLNVCLQTPASHPSAITKAVSNFLDISKPVSSQATKSTISNQMSSCNVIPITTGCLQSAVSLPSQMPKLTRPHITQSHTSLNSVHSIGSQVTDKVSQLDAQQMMYQGAPSGSRPEFRKNSTNIDKTRAPRLNHSSSDGAIRAPTTASMPLVASSVFPAISVANKGLSLAPATTFGSGYYPHGLHLSLSSNCNPTYTDSIKTSPLSSLAGALVASNTLTTSTLPFPTPLVSLPISLANVATVTAVPSLTPCSVLSAPGVSSGTTPSPTLTSSLASLSPTPRSSASPVPALADSSKKTANIANATDRLPSVVPSSCSSVVDTVPSTTTVAVTISINATSNAITPVNTLATTSSITNAEALLSCCTALATLPVIGSVPTLAVSSDMSLCTAASTTAPLSSVGSVAVLEQTTAATLQRNVCSSAVSVSSMTDTAASIVGTRTSPVTTCSGENTHRGSLAATATQERGGGGGGTAAAGPDGSWIRPPVQSSAATTSVSSNSSSSSVATIPLASSAAATASCGTAGVPLPTRKEAFPQSQTSGCSPSRGSVGEHSVLNVMESGGCEPQSSACTPVCDVTHVIDAKQQCAEPSVSSKGGPRPCLKS